MVKDYVGSQVIMTHQFIITFCLSDHCYILPVLYAATIKLPDTKRKWIIREWKHSLCTILEAIDALTGSGVVEGTGLGLDLTTDSGWLHHS